MEQDWPKEPWKLSTDDDEWASIDYVTSDEYIPIGAARRIVACVNACAGVPTECLERVEQGKSSIIVADEVLNGQRAHFVMPDSTIT